MNDKQIANLRADLLQKIRASGADVEEMRQSLASLSEEVETCSHQVDIAPTFSATENYAAGDLVYNDGALYRFTADHNAGAWTGEDVELTDIASLLDELTGDISDLQPVDSVTDGESKPVTSNAVYDAITSLSLADRDLLDWDNSVDIASGTEYTPSKNGILIAHGVATGAAPTGTLSDLTLGYTVANTYSAGSGTNMGCNIIAVKGHKYRLNVFNVTMTLTFIPFK